MLIEKIHADLKEAMKSGDSTKVSTLRMLISAIKNREIELRSLGKVVDDSEILSVIGKQVKQRKESISSFTEAGRTELADKEKAELAVLLSFLPAQLSEEEVREEVKKVISSSENREFGVLMKPLMATFKGKADGSIVKRILEEELKL